MIYLDNAATTRTAPEVVQVMLPYFSEQYGNPSTIYSLGAKAKSAVSEARSVIAQTLGVAPEEIYFTAGGSESDNWALKATAESYALKGKHIITSKIEHHAVLHTCKYLEKKHSNPCKGPKDSKLLVSRRNWKYESQCLLLSETL